MKRTPVKILCAALAVTATAGTSLIGAGAATVDFGFTGTKNEKAISVVNKEDEGDELPSSYSSRDLGYVTPVKSQIYNSCWAFAGLATFESMLLRMGFEIEDMSTTHLNLWATRHSDGTGWLRDVESDGYPVIPIGYLTSWQGGVFQSEVSDLVLSNTSTADEIPTDLARFGVTSVKYHYKDQPNEIKRSVMDYGGVYTSFAHTASCYGTDGVSYYMPPGYTGYYTGHSIEIVGWDDNYPKESFNGRGTLPSENGAWLIKNSWGDNNPLGGYFWMSYEDAYVFTQKYTPSYSFTGVEKLDGTKKLIQNEIYGATYEFEYIKSDNLTFLNRFDFDEDYNVIDKITFETKNAGAKYSLYFVPDGEDNQPESDLTKWTKLYDGTVDYAGYICADIDDFEYSAAKGSIAVNIDASEISSSCSIGVGEWLTAGNDMVFKNKSKHGDSYIMQDGSIQDLMDWYEINNGDTIGGTFTIKAITAQYYPATLLGDANLDGFVNINDVTQIQRHLSEMITLKKTAASNADYNQDGSITIDDCTMIQRFLAEYDDFE